MTELFCLLIIFHVALSSADTSQCYYPDGTPSQDVPCNTNATYSSCCPTSSFCLASSLCFGAGAFGSISRSGCTDSTYQDSSCPRYQGCTETGNGAQEVATCETIGVYACIGPDSYTPDCGQGKGFTLGDEDLNIILRQDQVQSLNATGVLTLDPTAGLLDAPIFTTTSTKTETSTTSLTSTTTNTVTQTMTVTSVSCSFGSAWTMADEY